MAHRCFKPSLFKNLVVEVRRHDVTQHYSSYMKIQNRSGKISA